MKSHSEETAKTEPSTMRGFGFLSDLKKGCHRYWYIDKAGVKRWADNDEEVNE